MGCLKGSGRAAQLVPAPPAPAPAPRGSGCPASGRRGAGGTRRSSGSGTARPPFRAWSSRRRAGARSAAPAGSVRRACSDRAPPRLAGRGELGARAVGPGPGVEALEHLGGRAAAARGPGPGCGPAAGARRRPAWCGRPRSRRGQRVLGQRLLESRGEAARRRPASSPWQRSGAGQRPGLALGARRGRRSCGGDLLRLVAAPEPQVGVDEIGRGREVGVGDPQVSQQLLLPLEVRQPPAPRHRGRARARPAPPSPRSRAAPSRVRRTAPALRPRTARHSCSRPRRACSQARPARPNVSSVCWPLSRARLDGFLVAGLGDGPPVGGGLIAGDQVEHEGQRADRGAGPGGAQHRFEQRALGAGLAQEQRPDSQPRDQPQILTQLRPSSRRVPSPGAALPHRPPRRRRGSGPSRRPWRP